MKKSDLDSFIGKKVTITLFDDDVISGELHKTGEEIFKNDLELYLPQNYYVLINPLSCIFRCSHIKKMEVNKE